MPYRTMEQPSGPKFTYVERLFLSGLWYNRLYGHVIILGRYVGGIVVVSGVVLLCGAAALAAIAGLYFGINYVTTHLHMSPARTCCYMMLVIFLCAFIGRVRDFCKSNRKDIERNIQEKLNNKEDNE